MWLPVRSKKTSSRVGVRRVRSRTATSQLLRATATGLMVAEPLSIADRLDLTAALATLPKRQRQAIALRYYLDLSESDIAGELGISVSSVKTHIQRALQSLRTRLTDLTEAPVGVQ